MCWAAHLKLRLWSGCCSKATRKKHAYYSTCIRTAIMCMWIVNSHVLDVVPVILQLDAKPFQCRASSWPRSEVGGMRTINLWAAVVEKLCVIGCRAILMILFNQRQGRCFFTDKVRSKHFWFGDFATSLQCISLYVCVYKIIYIYPRNPNPQKT